MKSFRVYFFCLIVLFFAVVFGRTLWRHAENFYSHQRAVAHVEDSSPKHLSVIAARHVSQPRKKRFTDQEAFRGFSGIRAIPAPLHQLSVQEQRDFPGATIVEAAEIEGPEPSQTTRLRILKTDFKYPFIRTEEIVDANNTLVKREEMVASHLLVTLPEQEDPEVFLKKLGAQAVSIVRVTQAAPLYRVNLASASLKTLPQGLETTASVSSGVGEPDFIEHTTMVPNDPGFSKQWAFSGMHYAIDTPTLYPGIHAQGAWDIRTDASSVIVAVIDSGIRYNHPDLATNMWVNPSPMQEDLHGWNAYDNNEDPMDPLDNTADGGHGTHCAGTIGAAGNNGKGVCGVAWKVQLMACKFIGSIEGSVSDEIVCIDYAIQHGAQIFNCSFGTPSWSYGEYAAYWRACDAGIIVVCAAGNNGVDTNIIPLYPASYHLDNIVAVAASNVNNELVADGIEGAWWNSNYGGTSVHLVAPGHAIYSTFGGEPSRDRDQVDRCGNPVYTWMDGTSAAAPFVTGAFALLKAEFPLESHQSLIARLLNATDKIPALKGKTITGGVLNIEKALSMPAPILAPTPFSWDDWTSWFESNW